MPSVDEKRIREEVRRLREKGKSLSGFWVSEIASAIYALEWVLGKRDRTPSEDVGERDSGHGKLAESISKAAEKTPPSPVTGWFSGTPCCSRGSESRPSAWVTGPNGSANRGSQSCSLRSTAAPQGSWELRRTTCETQ